MITAKCAPYLRRGKPAHRSALQNLDDYDIVATYGAEYRGIVQYYLLASDVGRFSRLRWAAETSMLKTLAAKHQSTVSKIAGRYRATIATPYGTRVCFEARVVRVGKQPLVARFGGIPLAPDKARSSPIASPPRLPTPARSWSPGSWKRRCELCEQLGKVVVHQVRKLAVLGDPGQANPNGRPSWPGNGARPSWSATPVTRPSTTGMPPRTRRRSLESRMLGNGPVRFGGRPHGKGPAPRGHLAVRPTQWQQGPRCYFVPKIRSPASPRPGTM